MLPQYRCTGAVQRQLVQHSRTRLLQCVCAVLASPRIVVVEEQASHECVEEALALEFVFALKREAMPG